jgi:antirestriction protein ArdC
MTYRQSQTRGYQVLRGEKGTQVQYWRFDEERTMKDSNGRPVIDANGESHTEKVRLERPQVFIAYVFNCKRLSISHYPHLFFSRLFCRTAGMMEIGEVPERKRGSREEIQRLVVEFEASGLRRNDGILIRPFRCP